MKARSNPGNARAHAESLSSSVSGLRPRFPDTSAESVAEPIFASIALEEERLQRLERELDETKQERDALAMALEAALSELATLRAAQITVPPLPPPQAPVVVAEVSPAPPPLPTPKEPRHREALSLERIVVTADDAAALDASGEVPADRRDQVRLPCAFEVEFMFDTHFISGLTEDLSTGGVFVATYHLLPVGSAVTLGLELPHGRRLEVRGEVRWTRAEGVGESRPGLGIAFKELEAEAHEVILALCRSRPPLYFDV